jgi:hypothetical protein
MPAVVVVRADDVRAPRVKAGMAALERAAAADPRMGEPLSVDVSVSGRAARVSIPLAGEGTDQTSNRALERLRETVIPATIGRVPGVEAHTTGMTASSPLLDATVVRAVLLPAAMTLLGDWNWYLPRWLEWLRASVPKPLDRCRHPMSSGAHPSASDLHAGQHQWSG